MAAMTSPCMTEAAIEQLAAIAIAEPAAAAVWSACSISWPPTSPTRRASKIGVNGDELMKSHC